MLHFPVKTAFQYTVFDQAIYSRASGPLWGVEVPPPHRGAAGPTAPQGADCKVLFPAVPGPANADTLGGGA